jgi:hypothetical protein
MMITPLAISTRLMWLHFMGYLHHLLLHVALCCRRQATTDRIASNFVSDIERHRATSSDRVFIVCVNSPLVCLPEGGDLFILFNQYNTVSMLVSTVPLSKREGVYLSSILGLVFCRKKNL